MSRAASTERPENVAFAVVGQTAADSPALESLRATGVIERESEIYLDPDEGEGRGKHALYRALGLQDEKGNALNREKQLTVTGISRAAVAYWLSIGESGLVEDGTALPNGRSQGCVLLLLPLLLPVLCHSACWLLLLLMLPQMTHPPTINSGTFVFAAKSGEALFAHRQQHLGDEPRKEELLVAVRAALALAQISKL